MCLILNLLSINEIFQDHFWYKICAYKILNCSIFLFFFFNNQCIGAVNTIVRRPTDGKLVGYNTDCEASITAIEDALRGTALLDALFPIFTLFNLFFRGLFELIIYRWASWAYEINQLLVLFLHLYSNDNGNNNMI